MRGEANAERVLDFFGLGNDSMTISFLKGNLEAFHRRECF